MKKILVALDASPQSSEVLKTAVDLAKRTGAKLTLLRATSLPVEIPPSLFTVSTDSLAALLQEESHKGISAQAESIPQELLDESIAVMGIPWQAICDTAKEKDVDMILVGAHGYGALERLLGTTAAKVVNHADRSVLVVRGRVDLGSRA